MRTKFKPQQTIKSIYTLAFLFGFFAVQAQLKGGHILGAMGLQSGTQTPANTLSVYIPGYIYSASSLKDANGNKAVENPDLTMVITGAGVSWVSDFKILGANYGATALFALASNTIQGNSVNVNNNLALTDTYIQPIQLGWHTKKADFVVSYQMYLPTGKFTAGAPDNSGLGMFMNEFSAGTTLFFDEKKTFHFATLASYEINGKKKDTNVKTGDILSVEGGLGKTFYVMNAEKTATKGILNAGLIYYLQYKVTSDEIPVPVIGIVEGDNDSVSGIGAEINYFHIGCKTSAGFRWIAEVDAINRFEGNTFFLTLAHVFSLKKEK